MSAAAGRFIKANTSDTGEVQLFQCTIQVVSLNKEKLQAFDRIITPEDLIAGKYLLVQKGKKNYFLLTVKA